MVATEVIVALISGGVAIATPIVACAIKKCSPDPVPPPITDPVGPNPPNPPNPPCMIQSTKIKRVLGYPVFNSNSCHLPRMQCKICKKWLCPYHFPINSDDSPNGGHICVPVSNP